ncbi:MAG: hypothetical protein WD904_04805 [Dehalococcoidia bacterium]
MISGNNGSGIVISDGATGVQIQGNRIGTTANGQSALGNLATGVYIFAASGNSVGGSDTGEGNTIAFNNRGVRVDGGGGATISNAIQGNSIHSNTNEGIDNIDGGNDEVGPPVISGTGSAFGTACADCEIDVFSDSENEGRIYEGKVGADGNGDWTFDGPLTGPFITATATDPINNTSEFSEPFLLPATPTPSPSPTPSPTPTPTATPTSTATGSQTATATPTSTATAVTTPTPSSTGEELEVPWGGRRQLLRAAARPGRLAAHAALRRWARHEYGRLPADGRRGRSGRSVASPVG